MKSVMTNRLSLNPAANIQRSQFDRSHGFKTTFDASKLFPIFIDEALPGDTFNLNAHFFSRMATPIHPIMDNLIFETFFFEVPVRQVWDNWEKFNGEQDDPGDSTDFLIPTMEAPPGGYSVGDLADYFGIPINVGALEHSCLPFRAYNHIYNTWFRDQNLQNSLTVNKGDGPDGEALYSVMNRGKRHDYFTSSLPWPQKSDSGSVRLPLGEFAPVSTNAASGEAITVTQTSGGQYRELDASTPTVQMTATVGNDNFSLFADLSDATSATINQLRQSIAVQRLFEKDARGGTRYIEVIKSHFNVTSPDLRLQRPGYLGGGRAHINMTPVAQTTPDVQGQEDEVQGSLAAFATIQASGHGFTRSFTEHTIIIGLANVRADLTYQEGLNRMWSRQTRFDHFWPELAQIGEQEVLNKEIYAQGTAADEQVFGYQERFAEYRYKPSLITGRFRSQAAQSLDVWHLSQDFADLPTLSDAFIQDDAPLDRVIAVSGQPHFIMDAYFQLKCARPMPMYGIPGLDKL